MESRISIVVLEDNTSDFELEKRELRQMMPDPVICQVRDREEFMHALETLDPRLLLLDYSLPGFDGLTALRLAQQCRPNVPAIIVSGAIGEEIAIETMKAGATDYVLKNHLSRLGPVIQRALHEAEQEAKRREAEESLRRNEERFRLVIEHTDLTAWECDRDLRLTWVFNPHTGYEAEDLLGKTADEIAGEEGAREINALRREVLATGAPIRRTVRYSHPGKQDLFLDQIVKPRRDGANELIGLLGISLDVSDRIRAQQRLRLSLENLRILAKHSQEPVMVVDTRGAIESASEKAEALLGYSEGDLIGKNVESMVLFESRMEMVLRLEDLRKHAPRPATAAVRVRTQRGTVEWMSIEATLTHAGTESEKYLVKFERLDFAS